MDELLLLLAKKGAMRGPVRITTSEMGGMAGMSQQNASVRLRNLERSGLVERCGGLARITKKGADELRAVHQQLKKAFESRSIILKGKVVGGLKQGRFYMSLPGYRKAIERKLGFSPYPGTLNLELLPESIEKRLELRSFRPIRIPGFSSKGRTYGPIDAYRCIAGGMDGAVVFPVRSQHGLSVIEIIAPVYLIGELRLRPGSKLEVEAFTR